MRRPLLAALTVRVACALAIATAFAPDEYWQSLEVAHRLVFGYGHLTWEWAAGLRSYAHPLLFAAPYALLRVLRLDSAWALVRLPLLLQALAAAATDAYVAKLAGLLGGPQVAGWCLGCQLASWFNAYTLVRTYSNCLEALGVAAGSYHWLRSSGVVSGSGGSGRARSSKADAAAQRRHQRAWIACAALCVVFRPASALFWVLPAGLALWRQRGRALGLLLLDAISVGGGILAASVLVDRAFYGRWVLVPWEFFRFNLLAGASAQYGGHPWHWNLSQGLPAVAASLVPLLAAGLLQAGPERRQLGLLAGWSLATYSLPAHKEFRFLLPALQLLMPYCGLAAARMWGQGRSAQKVAGGRGSKQRAPTGRGSPWRWGALACIALQLPMAAYFLLVHQRAQVGVMRLIEQAAAADPGSTSVLLLTPCHATPFYSHVHRPIPMRFLDCSPQQHAAATAALNQQEQAWLRLPEACPAATAAGSSGNHSSSAAGMQLSQRQCFEHDPLAYVEAVLHLNAPVQPRLLVGYAPLMARLAGALECWGYALHQRLPNCWVQTDDDSPSELQSACILAKPGNAPPRRHGPHRRPAPLAPVAAATSTQLAPPAFPDAQLPAAPSAGEATAWDVYTWLFLPPVKAGAYVSATCLALGLALDASVIVTLAATAFLVYGYDRGIKDAVRESGSGTRRDEGCTTKRGRFMNRHQLAVRASLAAATIGGATAAAQLPATFVGGLLPILLISLAYAVPCLPGGHSMRTAPGGKTAVACSMWALGCAWLPAVACGQGAEMGGHQLAAMLLHTFLCSATSLFNDIRDLADDQRSGTRSLPVLLGRDATLGLLAGVAALDATLCLALLGQPALLLPNLAIAAHALDFDSGHWKGAVQWGYMAQLVALAAAAALTMDLLVLLDAKWYGHCHQQSEDELDKQPPRLQRGSAGSLSDAAAHEQADVPPPQRRRQQQPAPEQQPVRQLPRLPSPAGQQTADEDGVLGTWAGRQRIFAEHLRQEEQELEPQRPRRPTAAGQHAGSPEAPTAAAEAGSAPEEAALPEASLRQHGNTPVVLAPPPLARPAAAEPSAIPEPTLDAEMNAAWRWRFTRKWQAEQMKQFDAAPEGGGGDDEEEWAAALRLMDATDGLNMQIGRTLSLHTSSMADGSMGLEQSLTLISPMDQSLSQCMLLDMDGSVKESPLRDDTAAATSQLVSVARKAQHLRRQQQEIERQVTERWEAAAGGPEWVAQHLPAVQIDSWSAFAFVLVRLTEPRSQRQKLLVRGRNGTTEQQAFATVEQEAARAAVARRLPGPKVDLLACGRMEWVAPPSNGQRRTLLVRVSRLLPPATKDARLHSAAAASGVVAELTRSSLPSGDFEVATADSFASGSK
ncbi:GPI mannosyltransferase 3 [Chlorella sorokiniana]|uniref:Mannosyltransferase n=1 Tax=Chlorella sorokiniana TaxID=3076 RepID=A0A2P6TBS3_CHLSO|nr:GPI mannosyltransferase 3 [Chlorella sorokiniana]|eukprot:PRW18326.1 GPI mannosyltransferase 3 [Chlorella sorokiniana]